MAILDAQGRVFGKVNILDLGAALIILLVLFGLFFVPGTAGTSVTGAGGATKPIEVDVMVRGLTVRNPDQLVQALETEKKTNIIIRNQPYGQVDLKGVQRTPRSVAVPQPDGSVKAFPDPRPELDYTIDMLITLGGKARMTGSGPVLGNSKVKVGTPIELEGLTYSFNTSVVDVRVLD